MDRPNSSVSPELTGVCLSLAVGGTALLATATAVVCGIRLVSYETPPLSTGPALAVTLLTAAWCASIRAAWLVAAPKQLGQRWHLMIAIIPFCSALLMVRAVTFFPITEFSTFLLWFAALAQETITLSLFVTSQFGDSIARWTQPILEPASPSNDAPIETPNPMPTVEVVSEVAQPVAETEEAELESEEKLDLPPNVTQQLTRGIELGQEQIHGLVRATFAPGQRHAYLHVGFCPPLPSAPHVELHQLEGPEVQIKPGQILTSGVRFDLKLRDAGQQEAKPVFEFIAICPIDSETGLRQAG
ncbi:hypothetical protein GC197_05275 [bacterium]|nr:hypothetical protein [bacterium]